MKNNFKKLKARTRRRTFLWILLIFLLGAMVVVLSMNVLDFTLFGGALGLFVMVMLVAILVGIIITVAKNSKIKRQITSQGTLESFNGSAFTPVGSSKQLNINNDWLVYNHGYRYQFFNKNRIRGVQAHPNQREGNAIALLDIFTNDRNQPLQVQYRQTQGENVPQMLWNWVSSGVNNSMAYAAVEPSVATPMSTPVIKDGKITCPCCMAPNDASLEYCTYCGSKLARIPNDTSLN